MNSAPRLSIARCSIGIAALLLSGPWAFGQYAVKARGTQSGNVSSDIWYTEAGQQCRVDLVLQGSREALDWFLPVPCSQVSDLPGYRKQGDNRGCPPVGSEPKLPRFIESIAPAAERGKFLKTERALDSAHGAVHWAYATYQFENVTIHEGSFTEFAPYQFRIEWKGRECAKAYTRQQPLPESAECQDLRRRNPSPSERTFDLDFEGRVSFAQPRLEVLIERVHRGALSPGTHLQFGRIEPSNYGFERGKRYRFKLRAKPFEVIRYPHICEDIQPLGELPRQRK
jgi:hypothetical protein